MVRDAAGVLVEVDNQGASLSRAERIVTAIEILKDAGFAVILLPPGASVKVRKPRWWRKEKGKWTT